MAPETAGRTFLSGSPEATEALGEALGRALFPDAVVALEGELGAGKTTLVRGLARGLRVEGVVASPTYTLMQVHAGRLALYHFDAWLEGREKALFLDGGEEWLSAGGVSVVEWAPRVAQSLPTPRLALSLEHLAPSARRIRLWVEGVEAAGGPYGVLLAALVPPAGLEELPAPPARGERARETGR